MRRAGFTLLELLVALGLCSLLFLALVRLLDTSTRLWERTETNRDLAESGALVMDLIARDLRSLEGGPRGDLLVRTALQDLDRDGIGGRPLSRLLLVREVAVGGGAPASRPLSATRLVEIAWALVPSDDPDPDRRAAGLLVRGERAREPGPDSLFAPETFDEQGRPRDADLRPVSGSVLWLGITCASSTTVLYDGWHVGGEPGDARSGWDAWDRRDALGAPSVDPAAQAAGTSDALPRLPRRVRIELELERPSDLLRRPRVALPTDPSVGVLVVSDARNAPRPGTFLLVDEEWMELIDVNGDELGVRRGVRGTRPAWHERGARVHHGHRVVREVPLAGVREDWHR